MPPLPSGSRHRIEHVAIDDDTGDLTIGELRPVNMPPLFCVTDAGSGMAVTALWFSVFIFLVFLFSVLMNVGSSWLS
jgi:hypothetical protein